MGEALVEGRDIHADFAVEILNGAYTWQEIKKQAKLDPESECGKARQASKPCNFGMLGGMGALTFVVTQKRQENIICRFFGLETCKPTIVQRRNGTAVPVCSECLDIAKELKRKWYAKWEVQPYFDRVVELIDGYGEVPALAPDDIRAGGVLRMRGGVGFSDAANNFFQSIAAAGAKAALWEVTKRCWLFDDEDLLGSSPRFFMHDEFLLVSPEDRAERAAKRMSAIMVEQMQRYVPDVAAGVKVEYKILDRWQK
jgi:hypothetical protein